MKDKIVKFEPKPKTITIKINCEINYEAVAEAIEIALRVDKCKELFIKKKPLLKLVTNNGKTLDV